MFDESTFIIGRIEKKAFPDKMSESQIFDSIRLII